MFRLVKKKPVKPITLKEHYTRRNQVLIKRRVGGFGDVLMQRMLFEDFVSQFVDIEFTYCCPQPFLEFAKNNPYCKTKNINEINERKYGIVYDITTACRVHESKYGSKNTLHRSDIWAGYCGVKLRTHNMNLKANKSLVNKIKDQFTTINPENKKIILLAAKSTKCEFGVAKSLTDQQIYELVVELRKQNFLVISTHNETIRIFTELQVPQFVDLDCESWLALVDICDYVISVDTSVFHIAGGLKKPLVGIFTFTDGKIYGKYYDFELVQKHRDNGDWDCGPCFTVGNCPKTNNYIKPCLTQIKTLEVINALKRLHHES